MKQLSWELYWIDLLICISLCMRTLHSKPLNCCQMKILMSAISSTSNELKLSLQIWLAPFEWVKLNFSPFLCAYFSISCQIDRFGHFKVWHGAGSLLVSVSFSSVFGGCILCRISGTDSSTLQTVGYSIFAAIFNIGWASTQVSHM